MVSWMMGVWRKRCSLRQEVINTISNRDCDVQEVEIALSFSRAERHGGSGVKCLGCYKHRRRGWLLLSAPWIPSDWQQCSVPRSFYFECAHATTFALQLAAQLPLFYILVPLPFKRKGCRRADKKPLGLSRRRVARDSITLLQTAPSKKKRASSGRAFLLFFFPSSTSLPTCDPFFTSSSSHSQHPTLNHQQERKHTTTTMEFMSNLGGGAQADRPSLFELIAQDKMREMLEPALRYVIAVKSPFSLIPSSAIHPIPWTHTHTGEQRTRF